MQHQIRFRGSEQDQVATISKAKLQEIAETKMPDLNAASLEAAMSMIAGTARSMGVARSEERFSRNAETDVHEAWVLQ